MLYCKINRQIYSNGEYSNAEVIITRLNIINGEVCIDKNSNNPNCDIVLEGAKGYCNEVLVIGQMFVNSDDGVPTSKQYIGGSTADKAKLLFMIETFKKNLMDGVYDAD